MLYLPWLVERGNYNSKDRWERRMMASNTEIHCHFQGTQSLLYSHGSAKNLHSLIEFSSMVWMKYAFFKIDFYKLKMLYLFLLKII